MRKQEFLDALRAQLSALPSTEREEQLIFYSEMIDDRMEEGLTEEEAVEAIGSAETIAAQLTSESSGIKKQQNTKPKAAKRHLRTWEIVLLAVGSPIWASLALAALVIILSLYAVLWSLIVAVWAVFGALVGVGVGGIAFGIVVMIFGRVPVGLALIAVALVCAGLSIFLFFGCLAATKGGARLAKLCVLGIRKCFVKKEEIA